MVEDIILSGRRHNFASRVVSGRKHIKCSVFEAGKCLSLANGETATEWNLS